MHVGGPDRWAFRCFLACIFLRLTYAGISWQQWDKSFKYYTSPPPGSCMRLHSDGEIMWNLASQAIDEAWDVTSKTVDILDTYADETAGIRPRGLLFLLFGVKFKSNGAWDPDTNAEEVFQFVKGIFEKINKLKTGPYTNPKPTIRCLEDYATYIEHKLGTDGKQNKSDILIAQVFGHLMENGQFYPGMMYIESENFWYLPDEDDPPNGNCGASEGLLNTVAFTLRDERVAGVTLCYSFFELKTIFALGEPIANMGIAEINKFLQTGARTMLHEFVHLVSSDIVDWHAMKPPPGQNYDNRDWDQWVPVYKAAYGYTSTIYLGLTQPKNGTLNADSYAVLGFCLRYAQLDCLGTFQDQIKSSRRSLPFQVSQRAVEKIRLGEVDITNM